MHPGQCQMGSPSRIGEVQAGRGRSDLDGPLGKGTHRRILVELACWSSECGHCPRPPFPTPVASRAALVVPLRHGLFVGKQNRSTTAGTGCEMTATHRITDLSHASAGAHGGQGKTSRTGDAARGDQKQVVNPTKKKQSCTTFTHPSLTALDSATHGEPTRHAMKYRRGRTHQARSEEHTPASSLQRFKDLLGSACVNTLPEVQVLSGAVGLLITRCRNALDTSLITCPSLRAAGLARFLDRRLGINGIVIHCRDRLWSALRCGPSCLLYRPRQARPRFLSVARSKASGARRRSPGNTRSALPEGGRRARSIYKSAR